MCDFWLLLEESQEPGGTADWSARLSARLVCTCGNFLLNVFPFQTLVNIGGLKCIFGYTDSCYWET